MLAGEAHGVGGDRGYCGLVLLCFSLFFLTTFSPLFLPIPPIPSPSSHPPIYPILPPSSPPPEGYPDYSSPQDQPRPEGTVVLRHIVKDSGMRRGNSSINSNNGNGSNGSNGNSLGSTAFPPPPPMSAGQAESKEGDELGLGLSSPQDDARPCDVQSAPASTPAPAPAPAPPSGPRVLHGFQLAALFRLRPELSELAFLEIRNMEAARRYEGKG